MQWTSRSTLPALSSLLCLMRVSGRIRQGKSCKGAVRTAGATTHLTDPRDTHGKSKSVCACSRGSFFTGPSPGCGTRGWDLGWVGAILPAPTHQRGAGAAGFRPAGGGLKAARRAPHVRRQHRPRPQRRSPGGPARLAQGLPAPLGR